MSRGYSSRRGVEFWNICAQLSDVVLVAHFSIEAFQEVIEMVPVPHLRST
jgi:hypothetical protein